MSFDSQSTWMNNSAWVRNHGELKNRMRLEKPCCSFLCLWCYHHILMLICNFTHNLCLPYVSMYSLTVRMCTSSSLMLTRRKITIINLFSSPSFWHTNQTEPAFITRHLMLTAVSVLFTWKQGVVTGMTGCIPGVYECLLGPGPTDVALREGEAGGCTMPTWL